MANFNTILDLVKQSNNQKVQTVYTNNSKYVERFPSISMDTDLATVVAGLNADFDMASESARFVDVNKAIAYVFSVFDNIKQGNTSQLVAPLKKAENHSFAKQLVDWAKEPNASLTARLIDLQKTSTNNPVHDVLLIVGLATEDQPFISLMTIVVRSENSVNDVYFNQSLLDMTLLPESLYYSNAHSGDTHPYNAFRFKDEQPTKKINALNELHSAFINYFHDDGSKTAEQMFADNLAVCLMKPQNGTLNLKHIEDNERFRVLSDAIKDLHRNNVIDAVYFYLSNIEINNKGNNYFTVSVQLLAKDPERVMAYVAPFDSKRFMELLKTPEHVQMWKNTKHTFCFDKTITFQFTENENGQLDYSASMDYDDRQCCFYNYLNETEWKPASIKQALLLSFIGHLRPIDSPQKTLFFDGLKIQAVKQFGLLELDNQSLSEYLHDAHYLRTENLNSNQENTIRFYYSWLGANYSSFKMMENRFKMMEDRLWLQYQDVSINASSSRIRDTIDYDAIRMNDVKDIYWESNKVRPRLVVVLNDNAKQGQKIKQYHNAIQTLQLNM